VRVLTALGRARQAGALVSAPSPTAQYQSIDYSNLPEYTRKRATENIPEIVDLLIKNVLAERNTTSEMEQNEYRDLVDQIDRFKDMGINFDDPNDRQLFADLFGIFGGDAITQRDLYDYTKPNSWNAQRDNQLDIEPVYGGLNVISKVGNYAPHNPLLSDVTVALHYTNDDPRYGITIRLNVFAQKGSTGMGYTLIARQLAAIDELVRRGKVNPNDVNIIMEAVQKPEQTIRAKVGQTTVIPALNGMATWPKLGFNMLIASLPTPVVRYLESQGFTNEQRYDTNTLLQSRSATGVSGYDAWGEAMKKVSKGIGRTAIFRYNNPNQRRIIEEYAKRKGFTKQLPSTGVELDLTPDDEQILRSIWMRN